MLSGQAEMLVEDHDDPDVQRRARIIVRQTERIAKIVEQLLSFGRRRPGTTAPCDLALPVGVVFELLEGGAHERGIRLRLTVDGGDHRVLGDTDRLQQIVLNLIKNALVATGQGGDIDVLVQGAPDCVRLIVRDTGVGITKDAEARLCEPFFTTRPGDGGTGLGLAVVHALVTEPRGPIGVRSEVGRGTERMVTLPRLRDAKVG